MAKWKHDEERELLSSQIEKEEISYSSLPRKWKRDCSIVAKSKFEDVLRHAPKGFWKNKNFVKAVLVILRKESINDCFNKKHYEDFVKEMKKYNYSDSKIWDVVKNDFLNYSNNHELLKLLRFN